MKSAVVKARRKPASIAPLPTDQYISKISSNVKNSFGTLLNIEEFAHFLAAGFNYFPALTRRYL